MTAHPCLNCGACCAFYRVSFHWSETLAESFNVPKARTESISNHLNAMCGTNQAQPQCVALVGVVGKSTSCEIYDNRPSCCRSFKASFEDGSQNLDCEKARKSKGLKLLTLDDW